MNGKWRTIGFLASGLVLSLLLLGCDKSQSASAPAPKPYEDVGPTYRSPSTQNVTAANYQYYAPDSRGQKIYGGYPTLRVGMSRDQVRAALGLPDKSVRQYGNHGQDVLGWQYLYFVRCKGIGTGAYSSDDVFVEVYFHSPLNTLTAANAHNMRGYAPVGSTR